MIQTRRDVATGPRRGERAAGIRLGYACVNTQLPSPARTTRLKNATPERLRELIVANLDALEAILRWNEENAVHVFRLTSNLIPFGSHAANGLAWWVEFAPRLRELGELIGGTAARVSTHPGQYTVLSSAEPAVAAAAVAELEYHGRLFDSLGLDGSHKIVIHVGSGVHDRADAFERFAAASRRLSPATRARLALENDERWPLAAVLELAERLALPVVFDAFHHVLAPSLPGLGLRHLVLRAAAT